MSRVALSVAAALGAFLLGGEALAQTPIPPPAKDFAAAVAQSDQYEILAAHDALAQSRDPRVRDFARQMIDDHRRSTDSLRQAATAAGLPPPPPAMGRDQAAMLSALQSVRGEDFDKAYARQQVLAHRQAIAVISSYADGGAEPNLRALARSAAPMIQHHLELAEQLRAAVGGS